MVMPIPARSISYQYYCMWSFSTDEAKPGEQVQPIMLIWQIPYQCNNEWFEHRFKFDPVKMTDGHHAKTQCFIISKLWHKEGLKVWISNMHQTLLKMRITWLELNPNKHNKFDTQPSVRRLQMEVWPFLLLGLHPQTWFEEKLIGNLKVFPEFWMESNGKWLKWHAQFWSFLTIGKLLHDNNIPPLIQ